MVLQCLGSQIGVRLKLSQLQMPVGFHVDSLSGTTSLYNLPFVRPETCMGREPSLVAKIIKASLGEWSPGGSTLIVSPHPGASPGC